MKRLLQAASAALLLGTAGCDGEPTVEECRVVVQRADAEKEQEEKALAEKLAIEKATTGKKAMDAIAEKTPEERTPQEAHDFTMQMAKDSNSYLRLMYIAEIQRQVREGNTLYTEEEKAEMPGLIMRALNTDPLSATHYYGEENELFGIDLLYTIINRAGSTPLAKEILNPQKADGDQYDDLVFNDVEKVKEKAKEMHMPIDTDEVQKGADAFLLASAQKGLDPKKADGDQYDYLQFYNLGKTIQVAKEAGFNVDMASLQPLADAFLLASAQKGLDQKNADGDNYDYLKFYNLGKTIQAAKEAGFNVDMASLQPLADAFLAEHNRKVTGNDLNWKELKETAQTAGFTVVK